MFFNLFRPKPKFSVGQLVFVGHDMRLLKLTENIRYMRIEDVEWRKLRNEKQQWGYSGPIFTNNGQGLVFAGHDCALESVLSLVDPQPEP